MLPLSASGGRTPHLSCLLYLPDLSAGCFHMAKKILLSIFALLAIAGIAIYFLLRSYPVPEKSEYSLDLEKIRSGVKASDNLPIAINAVVIAGNSFPELVSTAGRGFTPEQRVIMALQIVFEDSYIIIDTAHDQEQHRKVFGEEAPFDLNRYEALQQALLGAREIYVSHTHGDHIGGIAQSANIEQLLPKLHVNKEQFEQMRKESEITGTSERAVGFQTSDLTPVRQFDYQTTKEIAPGVVAIKAIGHSPGNQMFYIRLKNGKDYLYVGDVIWSHHNITDQKSRPYFVSNLVLGEDSRAVAHQLRTLINVKDDITFIIAHDKARLTQQLSDSLFGAEFQILPAN